MGDNNKTAIFKQKYGKGGLGGVEVDFQKFNFQKRDGFDFNLSKKKDDDIDFNVSNVYKTYDTKEARKISEYTKSGEHLKRVDEATQNILFDKKIDLAAYGLSEEEINKRVGDVFQKKERYFLCISSSMPKSLIQNYLRQIETDFPEIEVVLNGFIGGISKVKKTIEFINEVIKKDEGVYAVTIQINPKIFMQYKIDRVPALIYDKKFNNELLENTGYKAKKEELYSVIYGAASLKSMIKQSKLEF